MSDDKLPPLPSVMAALGLGSPQFRLRRSCVSTLLAEVLPGTPSDATLEDVVQRVRDCGKAQELIDCSIMDGCGLVCTLDYEHGVERWPGRALLHRLLLCADVEVDRDWHVELDRRLRLRLANRLADGERRLLRLAGGERRLLLNRR